MASSSSGLVELEATWENLHIDEEETGEMELEPAHVVVAVQESKDYRFCLVG